MNKDKQIKRLKAELIEVSKTNLQLVNQLDENNDYIKKLNYGVTERRKEISRLSEQVHALLSDNEIVERQLKDKTRMLKITENKLMQERTSLMNLYDLSQRIKEQSGISHLIMMIEELAKEGVEDRRKYQERKERR